MKFFNFALCLFFWRMMTFIGVGTYQPFINTDPDYATSPIHFAHLIEAESHLILRLMDVSTEKDIFIQKYIEDFQLTLLEDIGLKAEDFRNLLKRSLIDLIGLGNDAAKHPFKIYMTIRRLLRDFPRLKQAINDTDFNEEVKNPQFPKERDLQTSIFNVLRINQIFKIPFQQFLEGQLGNIQTGCNLSVDHLLELGEVALENKLYSQAVDIYAIALWSTVKSQSSSNQSHHENMAPVEIYGLLKEAIKRHDDKIQGEIEVEDIYPESGPMIFNDLLYNITHANFKNRIPVQLETIVPQANYSEDDTRLHVIRRGYAFQDLCQGKIKKTPKEQSKLFCYLSWKSHPSFTLNPLKIEVLNIEPPILQYHDILTEREMSLMRNEVSGELRTSRTIRSINDEGFIKDGEISRHRTSSNAWIEDFGHLKFMPVLKRVGRILNVNTKKITCSENMQIAAYSPGGHYVPHTDAIFEEEIMDKLDSSEFIRGDRIITFMIYLSEVESGGGTAFPILNTFVKPKKGSAVMWYNVHPDGSIDRRTLHGGCSVIYGVKWIANKWIRSHDQMLSRKCPSTNPTSFDLNFHI